MRRTALEITEAKVRRAGGSVDQYYCLTVPKLGGGRRRRFFPPTLEGKREAKTVREILKNQLENEGIAAVSLPEQLRTEAVKCQQLLEPVGSSLTEAVQFYWKEAKRVGGKKGLKDRIGGFAGVKRKAGRRESYVRILEWVLKAFAANYKERNVNEITRHHVEAWLDGNQNLATRKNRIRDLSIFFEFCRRRGYCASNPLENIERPIVTRGRPEIFTVDEAAALLTTADLHPELEFVPAIAIGLFAGLRTEEIKKLDWSNIDFEHREIDVDARIAKRRQQRNVEICDCLIAWLTPYAKAKGPVYPVKAARRKMKQLRELARIAKWPDNGLRHSYGSYHIAHFQNPNLTALQMGHATTDTLFNHYRNYRIRKKDAEMYWKLLPASGDKKLIA